MNTQHNNSLNLNHYQHENLYKMGNQIIGPSSPLRSINEPHFHAPVESFRKYR